MPSTRPNAVTTVESTPSTVSALELLLLRLAIDAEFRDRAGLDSLHRNLLAAVFAFTVDAVFDLLKRLINLGQQAAFTLSQSPLKGKIHFRGSRIDLVGEIVGIQVDVPRKGLTGVMKEFLALLDENLLESVLIALLQLSPFPLLVRP